MKQFKQFLLALLVALTSSVTASAYDFAVDGIYYNILSEEDLTCAVTEGDNKYSGDIVIPSTATYKKRTFTVTSIGEWAFGGCESLTSVVIPNSVTEIGFSAFDGCSKLASAVIGNSVTKIGAKAFGGCSSLTSVVMGNSVAEIGEQAFRGCSSLTSVEIPNSVTEIGGYAFDGCSNLTSVTIGNSVTTIGEYAFAGTGLTSVTIPNSVTSIGDYAFTDCSSLTSVVIPDSVTEMGGSVFRECTGLTSVVIGNSVTKIEWAAFRGCSKLASVVIGNSVAEIGDAAFRDCESLKEITSLAIAPPIIYDEFTFEGVSKTDAVVKVPAESLAAYQTAEYWKDFWNIVSLNDEGGEGGDDEPETKQCAAPTIELVDGKLVATSATEGATCYTSITSKDFKEVDSNDPIELTGVYNITSYALADGLQNSETVTATLVWVNPTLEGSSDGVNMVAKKAVLIRTQGGSIIVSGTERGESIQLYSIDGRQLRSVSADDDQTVITCNQPKGEVVIVKYGDKAVKVLM